MLEFLADPQVWMSLLTLTALEIVLGIDNLIFLSIVSGRLPRAAAALARQIGLALALLGRLALLFSLTWIIGLTEPVLSILGFDVSWRDIVLLVGRAVPDRQGHDGDPPHARGRTSRRPGSARSPSASPWSRSSSSTSSSRSTASSPRSA